MAGTADVYCSAAFHFLRLSGSFSLGGVTIVFAILGVSTGYFHLPLLLALPDRVSGIMSNYILLAVPFFIFYGDYAGEKWFG